MSILTITLAASSLSLNVFLANTDSTICRAESLYTPATTASQISLAEAPNDQFFHRGSGRVDNCG